MNKKTGFLVILSLALVASVPFMTAEAAKKKPAVDKRMHNQNKRIEQGVKSGQLTETEAKDLRAKHKALRDQEKAMRAKNGGKLTDADKAKLQADLDASSKDIYAQKHDAEKKAK